MTAPSLESLIVGLASLAAFLSVLAAGLPLLRHDGKAQRLKAVVQRRRELSASQRAALAGRGGRFQARRHVGLMRAVLDRLNLAKTIEDKAQRARLIQAGWRRPSAPVVYVFSQIALPLLMMALTLLVLANPGFAAFTATHRLMACITMGAFGGYLPKLWLSNAVAKRQQALTRSFPDALDLMVICVEAGLSIEAAFQRVTEEMAESAPALSEEIALTSAEFAFLADRRQAYDNLAERTGLATIRSLTTALNQAERYGTPISVALRVLAQENREARMNAAEKKAASLPAKLTVPMILFFLPVLFMVIIGPAAIRISHLMSGH